MHESHANSVSHPIFRSSNWSQIVEKVRYPHENVTKFCGYDYKKNVMVLLITVKVRTFSYLLIKGHLLSSSQMFWPLKLKVYMLGLVFVHCYYWFHGFPSIVDWHYWIFQMQMSTPLTRRSKSELPGWHALCDCVYLCSVAAIPWVEVLIASRSCGRSIIRLEGKVSHYMRTTKEEQGRLIMTFTG